MTGRRLIFALAALALCLLAAGCGGDEEGKPIPANTATALDAELNTVQARLDNGTAGACRDILEGSKGPNDDRVQQLIGDMPDDVDADVRSALEDSFDRLWDLVQQECEERAAEEERQQQEEQQEPEPEPTETQTEQETTPPETEPPETTPPAEEEPQPEGDGENGGGEQGNEDGGGSGGGVGPGAELGGGE